MSSTIVVVGAVFERDGTFLACRRAPGKADAGLWEFPGGKVEPGETHQEALARELFEELNVRVLVGKQIDRSTTPSSTRLIDLSTYLVEPKERFPITSTDHDELRWVSKDALPNLEWARPDLPTVAALIR